MSEDTVFDSVTKIQFTWTFAAFIAAVTVALVTAFIVFIAKRYDPTKGLLTVSILVTQGFVTAAFASMIYDVRQNPITEILVGALATSMGAVIAHWTGGYARAKREEENGD